MNISTRVFLALLLLFSGIIKAQNLNLNITNSPGTLIQNGLLGTGVNVSNISGTIGSNAGAIFTNNGVNGLAFPSGLLISSGTIGAIENPPSYHLSTDISMPGDPTLNAIVAPAITYDAQVLSFEFSAAGDSVEFDFIFSSEEYNEYVNTNFNDVFGFFVTGPGYAPNTNVALIPGTFTPISINNVNNGNATGASSGPCNNCNYYYDNLGANPIGLAPDGFTTAINIRFPVDPCTPYTFKIAIADVGDGIFDSQVMMKAGSFSACSGPRIMANGVYVNSTVTICQGDTITLSVPNGPSYVWNTGETTQSIQVSQAGAYNVMYASSGCFTFSNNITVVVDSVPTPLIYQVNDSIYSNITGPGYTYSWSLNGTPLPGANQNFLDVPANGCYTMTVYSPSGCEATSNIVCINSVGIGEITQHNISIQPHPVTGTSVVETTFNPASATLVRIFDVQGRLVKSFSIQGNRFEISSGEMENGVYILELQNGTEVINMKFVVN